MATVGFKGLKLHHQSTSIHNVRGNFPEKYITTTFQYILVNLRYAYVRHSKVAYVTDRQI